jgi:hypothetical protein
VTGPTGPTPQDPPQTNRYEALAQRWRQRVLLWRRLHSHWVQWERLLVNVSPDQPLDQSVESLAGLIAGRPPGSPRAALLQAWRRSALGSAAPLATLAVAQELAPILDTLHSLALLPPLQPLPGGQSR